MALSKKEKAAQTMEHLCAHDAHGYAQDERAGDGTVETVTYSDGSTAKIHGGDYDCSEADRMCYAAAGILPWGYWDSYIWTGNEEAVLKKYGFVDTDLDSVVRGDALWREGHTAIYLGGGKIGEAYWGDNGANNNVQGDQSGYEVRIAAYDPDEWTKAWTYPEKPAAWVKNAKGWWYRREDGTWPASKWEKINGDWYWFDAKGYAAHDAWRKSGGKWYWLGSDCRMVKSTCKSIKGKWYAFGADGAMLRSVSTAKGGALVL